MKICVLGSGAWGTAVAGLLADNGYEVSLWSHEESVAEIITKTGVNTDYLPDAQLPKTITATHSLEEALTGAEFVFEAVPVQFLRSVLEDVKPYANENHKWVVLSKGMEQKTLALPSDLIKQVIGTNTQYAVLVGPSFAKDLAAKQLTGVSLASNNNELVKQLTILLENDYFKVTFSDDVVGVQLCAALKNVVAFGVGILKGAEYTDNTKALFLVKSLEQMSTLLTTCGGDAQTVMSLAGVGDLLLTACGNLSRNLAVGKRFGKGEALESITKETKTVPESINSVVSVFEFLQKKSLKLSIFEGIYEVVQGQKTAKDLIINL